MTIEIGNDVIIRASDAVNSSTHLQVMNTAPCDCWVYRCEFYANAASLAGGAYVEYCGSA